MTNYLLYTDFLSQTTLSIVPGKANISRLKSRALAGADTLNWFPVEYSSHTKYAAL